MTDTDYEALLSLQCSALGLPAPQVQFLFARPIRRKWRADLAWPDHRLLVEVQGWGRHQRFVGYEKDCERMNEAAILGWKMLWVTPAQVINGAAVAWIERIIKADDK